MQLHQLKYIAEVHRTGSISKAAENLYLTQPNLSNAISELEKELQIKIFDRTNRGVTATDEGLVFLSYAKGIVSQVTNLEQLYTGQRRTSTSLRFAWSIQTADIPFQLINELKSDTLINFHLIEGSHLDVVNALAQKEVDIGALFIPRENIGEYKRFAKKHNLVLKELWSVDSCMLISSESQLASEEVIHEHMLTDDYIQMIYRPAGMFDLPNSAAQKKRGFSLLDRNIYFNDRATLLEILSACPNTYVQCPYFDPQRLKSFPLTLRPHTIHDHRYTKIILYQNQLLNKEMKWLLNCLLEEMTDASYPSWAHLTRPSAKKRRPLKLRERLSPTAQTRS